MRRRERWVYVGRQKTAPGLEWHVWVHVYIVDRVIHIDKYAVEAAMYALQNTSRG